MRAGEVVRSCRRAARVTQGNLAHLTGTPQPAISRIERTGGANFDTVIELLEGLGLRLIAVPIGTRLTVAEQVTRIREEIAIGRPTTRSLAQLTNTLVHADRNELPFLVATTPEPTGDRRIDAFVAALVEHVAGTTAPAWVQHSGRFLTDEWVYSPFPDDADLNAIIRSGTPPAFARHGVYVDASDLTSV